MSNNIQNCTEKAKTHSIPGWFRINLNQNTVVVIEDLWPILCASYDMYQLFTFYAKRYPMSIVVSNQNYFQQGTYLILLEFLRLLCKQIDDLKYFFKNLGTYATSIKRDLTCFWFSTISTTSILFHSKSLQIKMSLSRTLFEFLWTMNAESMLYLFLCNSTYMWYGKLWMSNWPYKTMLDHWILRTATSSWKLWRSLKVTKAKYYFYCDKYYFDKFLQKNR